MLTLRGHRSFRSLGVAVAVAVVAAVSSVGADVASAAEITDVTIDITTSPTVVPGEGIRTDMSFCIPDSTTAGDTFSVQLPAELEELPSGFTLRDPDGLEVASATISGAPATVTFTFTSYVDERVDVCGSAFFESEFSSSVTPNSEVTLEFVLSGGAVIEVVVTTGEPVTGTDRTTARKSGVFDDVSDECRTSLPNCLSWFIESQPGPFDLVHIVDDGLVDATFDCSTLSIRFWTLTPGGSRDTEVPASSVGPVTPTCAPDSLDVTVADVPAGVIVRTLISATPAVADADGDRFFVNTATVTQSDVAVEVDNVTGRVRSSAVGGQASGVTPPPTTTTTTTTTTSTTTSTTLAPTTTTEAPTTTGATTTTTDASTTTFVSSTTLPGSGSGAAAPTSAAAVTLPATGLTSETGFSAGLAFLAAGLFLTLAARRPARR